MAAQTVLIKKYENRRLYDTANSRYVNLDDIAQMVRDGIEVQVVDATTGEDLTRLVLTQIIAEKAKGPDSAFPLDMLRQMVIASGRMGQEGVLGYMKAVSDIYQSTYRAFTPATPFDFVKKAAEAAAPKPPAQPGEEQPDVDELRRRVEELERIVEKNANPNPTGKNRKDFRPKAH